MNIKILTHIMPYEIDQAYIMLDKLKQSIYHIDKSDTIYIDTVLNLSPKLIDWNNSKLPKELFIDKYKIIDNLLKDNFIHKPTIFTKDEIYGGMNLMKNTREDHIDFYIPICPDVYFSEYTLYYLIESAKQVTNKYFLISPQIFKCWDGSWDILVNEKFSKIPYKSCLNTDIHEILHISSNLKSPILKPINGFKFSGWIELYNKGFYEKLVPVLDEWNGYLPWDWYAMNVCNIAKNHGIDVQQYLLENIIIWFYDVGNLRNLDNPGGDGQLKEIYKKYVSIIEDNERHVQRKLVDNNLQYYIDNWIKYAIENKI
jgi:hypothetical protein